MRNLKRVLTMVMAIAMMMSLLTVGAGAAFPDQDKIENTDAVNMNVALGIIQGRDDGKFDPQGNVTRGEMAKMITIALNGGTEPNLGTQITPSYTDIKGHWAEKYIEYCTNFGIVAGMGDGTFAPDANVTGTQAAKMLLVALGYHADKESFNGLKWSISINARASQKGLYSGLAIDPGAALNRDNAAQMVSNALEAIMVVYDYELVTVDGKIQTVAVAKDDGAKTILTEKYKLQTGYGVLDSVTYNKSSKKYDHSFNAMAVLPSDGVALTSIAADADFSGLYGQQVKALYKVVGGKTTVFGMYAYDSKVVTSGIANDQDTSSRAGYIKFAGQFYKAEAGVNGAATNLASAIPALSVNVGASTHTDLAAIPAHYNVTLLDVDGDGAIDTATYLPYTVEKVTYVGSKNFNAGASYVIDDVDVYSGIAKNDFVMIVDSANAVSGKDTFTKVKTVLEGKITSVKYTGSAISSVQLGGTWYNLASTVANPASFAPKTNIADAPVVNGFIFEADTNVVASVSDYAVITAAVESASNGMNGDQAKLMFADGTKKTVDTTADYTANVGAMVKYEINSDGEYTLTLAATAPHGFDGKATLTGTAADFSTTTGGAVKQIKGMTVADDATVFLNDNGSYKVITGAALNKIAAAGLTAVNAFYTNTSNGYDTIQMAYITSSSSIASADKQFGYVTSKVVDTTNASGDSSSLITIWNGEEVLTLETKGNYVVSGTVAKGNVIAYTINKDGKVDAVKDIAVLNKDNSTLGAIKAYNGKDEVVIAKAISLQGGAQVADLTGATEVLEVNKDTVIIYIDAEGVTKVEGGAITLATKTANSQYAYANVYYQASAGEATLLVIDASNDILVQQ